MSIAFKVEGYEAIFHVDLKNNIQAILKKLEAAARISTGTEDAAQDNPRIDCDAGNKDRRNSSNNTP